MNSPLPNRFRQRILARERLIGFWMCMSSHITAELVGLADFDWLLLDGEHSPNEVPMFLQQLQALQGSASAAVGRRRGTIRWRSSACSISASTTC